VIRCRFALASAGGGFQEDGNTDQPARPHEQRTEAGDHAIPEPEACLPLPGAIDDQQLLLDEHRFGDDGAHAAGSGESSDGRQHMQNKDS
jgi:hypothetical protein